LKFQFGFGLFDIRIYFLIYAAIYVEGTINHSCCKEWHCVIYFASHASD